MGKVITYLKTTGEFITTAIAPVIDFILENFWLLVATYYVYEKDLIMAVVFMIIAFYTQVSSIRKELEILNEKVGK
jgi:hypothetical protein